MSKLIINENPLLVLPTLAATIGLNEAIILQQIHYWLDPRINSNYINGLYWVYNTYHQWAKQFPFWSEVTIRRTIKNLEKSNLLISDDFNKNPYLRLKWYTINYNTLENIEKNIHLSNKIKTTDQIDQGLNILTDHNDQLYRSNRTVDPINLIDSCIDTKTTTKITTKNSLSLSQQSKIKNTQKENEREKEMLNIWDKIIREGDKPSVHNQSRLISLKKILEDYFENNLENWENYCLNIKKSNFLMGGGANNWKADLTWAIRQENLIRVLEGYYHQKEGKTFENNKEELTEEAEEICNDVVWNKVKEILKIKRGEGTYKSWFKKLSLKGYEDDKVLLVASTKFIKEWIMNNYHKDIIDSFKQAEFKIKEVEIFVKNGEEALI